MVSEYDRIKLDVVAFSNGPKLLQYIQNETNVFMYLLDIEMDDINGLELGKKIRETDMYTPDQVYSTNMTMREALGQLDNDIFMAISSSKAYVWCIRVLTICIDIIINTYFGNTIVNPIWIIIWLIMLSTTYKDKIRYKCLGIGIIYLMGILSEYILYIINQSLKLNDSLTPLFFEFQSDFIRFVLILIVCQANLEYNIGDADIECYGEIKIIISWSCKEG